MPVRLQRRKTKLSTGTLSYSDIENKAEYQASSMGVNISLKNGKITADLEYHLMGERGDQYRNVGFPYVINTTYLVNPTLEYSYVDIHFYWAGYNEAVQKSERDLTLVAAKNTTNATLNSVITALNAALGVTIAALP